MKPISEERRGGSATGFSRATADSVLPRPVVLSSEAHADVERLHDWLFENNPLAAARLFDVLTRAFESLGEISERGRPVDTEGLRELIVPFGGSNYVVRYEPAADRVRIARIWHGLEDRQP